MSREYISDYKLGRVKNPDLPLAKAVAASSGFPPFYCPVEVEIPLERWSDVKGKELAHRDDLRKRMDLGDGAVYDNLGLTRLEAQWRKIGTILVSDAGDSLDVLAALPFEWLSQAMRTLLVSMDQTNKLRVKELNEDIYDRKKNGAYWGIADRIMKDMSWGRKGEKGENRKTLAELGKHRELLVDSEQTRAVGEMRTRLNRFTDEEQESLINWGYALADARMRRWVLEDDPPGTLPFPGRLQ
jgi:NTE family protein